MSRGQQHPFAGRDPRGMTEGEWRMMTDYRLGQIESRVDLIFKTLVSISVIVIAGVVIFWLTTSGPTHGAAVVLRWFA